MPRLSKKAAHMRKLAQQNAARHAAAHQQNATRHTTAHSCGAREQKEVEQLSDSSDSNSDIGDNEVDYSSVSDIDSDRSSNSGSKEEENQDSGETPKKRGRYTGKAPRTLRHKRLQAKQLREFNGQTIHSFFNRVDPSSTESESDGENIPCVTWLPYKANDSKWSRDRIKQLYNSLDTWMNDGGVLQGFTFIDAGRKTRRAMSMIKNILHQLLQGNHTSFKNALKRAGVNTKSGINKYRQRVLKFVEEGVLPVFSQGHSHGVSPLNDRVTLVDGLDFQSTLLISFRKQKTVNLDEFHKIVTATLKTFEAEHPGWIESVFKSTSSDRIMRENLKVSDATAHRWLRRFEYAFKFKTKDGYNDAHERPDVVQARKEYVRYFLTNILPHVPRFESGQQKKSQAEIDWEASGRVGPKPPEYVIVSQDETCVWPKDTLSRQWSNTKTGHGKECKQKGKGQAIMVSDFLTPNIGRLRLTREAPHPNMPGFKKEQDVLNEPYHASHTFIVGKQNGGYWDGDRMLKQTIEQALPILKAEFPDKVGVFIFDNSTCHSAYAEDALRATVMIAADGGKNQPIMRNGYYFDEHGNKVIQQMYTIDQAGKKSPKGMRTVLKERGLLDDNDCLKINCNTVPAKLRATCSLCVKHVDYATEDGSYGGLYRDKTFGESCCMRRVIALQPDFQAQRSQVFEAVEKAGHIALMLPKCHPELNFIELWWGARKAEIRKEMSQLEHSQRNAKTLAKVMKAKFDSAKVEKVQSMWNRSLMFLKLYNESDDSNKIAQHVKQQQQQHRKSHANPEAAAKKSEGIRRTRELIAQMTGALRNWDRRLINLDSGDV